MTGLGGDAVEPGTDRRIRIELEATLRRNVRVAVERDVRERQGVADDVAPAVEMAVERGKRAAACLQPLG